VQSEEEIINDMLISMLSKLLTRKENIADVIFCNSGSALF
jgi:hypothetical protein